MRSFHCLGCLLDTLMNLKHGLAIHYSIYVYVYKKKKKSGVALTQLSVTLHYTKRIFYYQHYIYI